MKKFHNSNLRILTFNILFMLIIAVVLFDNFIKHGNILILGLGAAFLVFFTSEIALFREFEINDSDLIMRNPLLKSETKIPISSIEKVEAERVFLSARALLSVIGILSGGSLNVIIRTDNRDHLILFTCSILQSQEKDAQDFVRALMEKIGKDKVDVISKSFFD